MENLLSQHLDMPFYAENKSGFSTASLGNPLVAPVKPKKLTRIGTSVAPVAPAPTQKVLEAPIPLKPRIDYSKTPTPPTVIVVAPDGSINGIPTVVAQAPVMGIPLENSANKTASGGGGGGGGAPAAEQSNEEGAPAEMGWFGMNPMQTKIAKGLTITLGLVAAWKYGLFGKLKTISK